VRTTIAPHSREARYGRLSETAPRFRRIHRAKSGALGGRADGRSGYR
jgi:hypothetical protein